jgi:hypothetical protein
MLTFIIPKGVAKVSQIFQRQNMGYILPKLRSYGNYRIRDKWKIHQRLNRVYLTHHLFTTSIEQRDTCHCFLLSRTSRRSKLTIGTILYFFRIFKMCTHTHHSRFIPERVADASQILFRDTLVLSK